MKRRVVITGLGAVSPVGNNVNDMWEAIKAGKNGIDYIKSFDTSNMRVKIAGEIKNLDFDDYLDPKEYRRNDRVVALGLIAAKEAYLDSNLDDAEFDRYRFGTFVSSGIGGVGTIYEQALVAKERGGDRVSPFFVPSSIINLVGGNIAIKYKAKGPNLPIVTACSSGADSIGLAFQQIRDNY
jgi:3-oxoacyl-[acyl-carrier-protein] synthase II